MSVLIVYRSKYGCTERCCGELARQIGGGPVIVNLASRRIPDIRGFDVVLIGGSIYGGKVQREVTSFCERSEKDLRNVSAGLFICCLYEGEHARAQLNAAFPDWLTAHAFTTAVFGGELRYRGLTLLDRLLVRSVSPLSQDVSHLRPEAVRVMADAVKALPPGR